MRRLVVVGAGTLGGAVAAAWVGRGGAAVGLTRTEARHPDLRAQGVSPATSDPRQVVRPDDVVLLSVSGSAGQTEAARALTGVAHHRAVLVGTTGIYGDQGGPLGADTPAGETPRALAAATAEATFRAASPGGVVVRLGGLYRTGRGPLSALLRRGAPMPGPPDQTLALIHYDDAASAIVQALLHCQPEPTYVGVVPPLPTRRGFYALACSRHGLPAPEFTGPSTAPPRRYDVASFTRDLLPRPSHPDWREATAG